MKHHIGLRQLNQNLAEYIVAAERGDEVIVTRRGKPIVKVSKVEAERKLSPEQQAALERSVARMKKGWSLGGKKFNRKKIYEG